MALPDENDDAEQTSALPAAALGTGALAYGAHHALKGIKGLDGKTKTLIHKFLALKNETDPQKQVKNYAQYGSDLVNKKAFGRSGKDIILGIRGSAPVKLLERLGLARKFTPGSIHHYEEFARGGKPALQQLRREVGRSPAALSSATQDALQSYGRVMKGILAADTALSGVQRFGRYGLPLAAVGALGLGYQKLRAKKQEGQRDALRTHGLPEDHLG